MITLGSAEIATLSSSARGAHWLVDLDFELGMQRVTTAPVDVVADGQTYTGLGQLLTVSDVSESENSAADKLTIGISAVNAAMLAATMGSIERYRGRAVRLYLQLFNDAFVPVGARVLRWSGYMEPVKVTRKRSDAAGGSSSGRIELPCSRAGMARARRYQGLRLTHAQQQQRFPGDRGLEYVQPLIEQPSLWLSKKFQEI